MRYLERAIWAGVLSLAGSILAGLLAAAPALWFLQDVLGYGCDTNDAFVCQRLVASITPGLAAVALPASVILVVGEAVARRRLTPEARRRLARVLALAAPGPVMLPAVVPAFVPAFTPAGGPAFVPAFTPAGGPAFMPAFTPASGPAALVLLELSATIILAALVIQPWEIPAIPAASGPADAAAHARSADST